MAPSTSSRAHLVAPEHLVPAIWPPCPQDLVAHRRLNRSRPLSPSPSCFPLFSLYFNSPRAPSRSLFEQMPPWIPRPSRGGCVLELLLVPAPPATSDRRRAPHPTKEPRQDLRAAATPSFRLPLLSCTSFPVPEKLQSRHGLPPPTPCFSSVTTTSPNHLRPCLH